LELRLTQTKSKDHIPSQEGGSCSAPKQFASIIPPTSPNRLEQAATSRRAAKKYIS